MLSCMPHAHHRHSDQGRVSHVPAHLVKLLATTAFDVLQIWLTRPGLTQRQRQLCVLLGWPLQCSIMLPLNAWQQPGLPLRKSRLRS